MFAPLLQRVENVDATIQCIPSKDKKKQIVGVGYQSPCSNKKLKLQRFGVTVAREKYLYNFCLNRNASGDYIH